MTLYSSLGNASPFLRNGIYCPTFPELNLLGAETHEPVTMLDHDRLNLGTGQELEEQGDDVRSSRNRAYGFNNAVVVRVNDEAASLCFPISFFAPTKKLGRRVRPQEPGPGLP